MISRTENIETLIKLYRGDTKKAEKVYSTLKHSYDHHASNVVKPINMFIDEHLRYINGLNNYVHKHIQTYYPEAKK